MENLPSNANDPKPETAPATPEDDADDDEEDTDRGDRQETRSSIAKLIGRSEVSKAEDPAEKPADKPIYTYKPFEQSKESTDNTDIETPRDLPEFSGEDMSTPGAAAPRPEMTEAETQNVAQQIAGERRAEIAEAPVDMNPEAQAETEAVLEFYDNMLEKGMDPEAAAAATAVLSEAAPETPVDAGAEQEQAEEDAAASATAAAGSTPLSPPTPPIPGSPRPPMPSPTGGGGYGGYGGGYGGGHGAAPTPPAPGGPSAAPKAPDAGFDSDRYDRSHAFSNLMVGGVVGYLIGRRRGRIKTERKLLPIQNKLEKEVTALTQTIAQKETIVRQAARNQVHQKTEITGLNRPLGEQMSVPAPAREMVILDRRERAPTKPVSAAELHKSSNILPPPERIGKVLVAAETEVVATIATEVLRPVKKPEAAPVPTQRSVEKQVEVLSRNELLTLSEKVIVEGSTLRQVYETNLITERGLRRLIVEYLRGGDVARAFKHELVEREIDFERDPKLRDTIRKSMKTGGSSSLTLQKLLQQAGVAPVDDDLQQTVAEARAEQLQDAKKQTKRATNRKIIDVSMIATIALLLALIIILALHRH
jgi:hypothetical protein